MSANRQRTKSPAILLNSQVYPELDRRTVWVNIFSTQLQGRLEPIHSIRNVLQSTIILKKHRITDCTPKLFLIADINFNRLYASLKGHSILFSIIHCCVLCKIIWIFLAELTPFDNTMFFFFFTKFVFRIPCILFRSQDSTSRALCYESFHARR